jgi:hypothetical protein
VVFLFHLLDPNFGSNTRVSFLLEELWSLH